MKHTDEGEIHQSTLVHRTVLEIEIENRNRNLEIELELEISRLFSSYMCDVRQKWRNALLFLIESAASAATVNEQLHTETRDIL